MKRRSNSRYNYDGGGNGGNGIEYEDSRIPFLRERVAITKGQHTQQHVNKKTIKNTQYFTSFMRIFFLIPSLL